MADAEVTFHNPPSTDHGTGDATGRLVDTPESRAALEQNAIPGCRTWRQASPELVGPARAHIDAPCTAECWQPAPYCCSAYCTRCAGLRALDGVPPLTPNQWMENPDG